MAFSLALIRWAQGILGDGPLARLLAKSGIARLVRGPRDRKVLRRGTYEAALLGARAQFAVTSRTQLEHIDALWREEVMLRRMVAALEPGDVFYDVGANIGIISLAVALNVRDVTIRAFEPEARNAKALRANLALNAVRSVHVHELALGASAGKVELHLDGAEGAGSHSLIPRRGLAGVATVELARADDLAPRLGRPAVVKIDVEGAEFGVVRGMERLLGERAVRDLFVELHPAQLAASGASVDALRAWLGERGYVPAWQQRRGDEWHEHWRPRS